MAKPEHLAKPKESVEVWKTCRDDNPEIVPALWGADLEEADLRYDDLQNADLAESVLTGAVLRSAKLTEAVLTGAVLTEADCEETDFKRTNLEGANLWGARYLHTEQLCEAKTLYQAKLDPELEREIRQECPRLFEKPVKTDNTLEGL